MGGGEERIPELFCYDVVLAKAASLSVFLPPEELVDAARPLGLIAGRLDYLEREEEDALELIRARHSLGIYYILMAGRELLPSFFPVHDICLLAANLLRTHLAEGQNLALLDWEMLPAAVLAAFAGVRVILPSCGGATTGQECAAEEIAAFLRRYLPEAEWRITSEGETPLQEGCVVLGQHPLRHSERDPRFLEKLTGASGGILYSSWDFLGVKIYAHTRSLWLKTGLIHGVLQLPRPRRQGAVVYPALVELGAPDPTRPLRLARIPSCVAGPGALDQGFAVALLAGSAPLGEDAIDIPPEDFARDGLFDLSPAAHLARQKMDGMHGTGGLTLRQCALVLHCQLPRKRIGEEEAGFLQSGAARFGGEWWGERPDGSFIGREVALGELDPLTGFLDEQCGSIVRLKLTLLGKQGKYVAQANDIIFAFRGSASSIGQVGFVEDDGISAVTGQALCLIRCLPGTDPVWLYYYLRRQLVREWVRGRATGSTLLTINIESIRDIPVERPSRKEVESINEEHRKIASAMSAVAELRRKIQASIRKIDDYESWARGIESLSLNGSGTGKPLSGGYLTTSDEDWKRVDGHE